MVCCAAARSFHSWGYVPSPLSMICTLLPGSMWVPVKSSMLRAKRGSSTLGGPSLSPSAITLRTGVSWVTDRMPMSARTTPNRIRAAIAMYLISDIFSLHDLRGPSANRDACYSPRPIPRIASHFPIERFRRGYRDILFARKRRTLACAAHPRRQTARHIRPGRLYRAPASVSRGRCSGGWGDQLYAPRISALDRTPRRRQNVRAAAISTHSPRTHHSRVEWSVRCRKRRTAARRTLHHSLLCFDRAPTSGGARAVYTFSGALGLGAR